MHGVAVQYLRPRNPVGLRRLDYAVAINCVGGGACFRALAFPSSQATPTTPFVHLLRLAPFLSPPHPLAPSLHSRRSVPSHPTGPGVSQISSTRTTNPLSYLRYFGARASCAPRPPTSERPQRRRQPPVRHWPPRRGTNGVGGVPAWALTSHPNQTKPCRPPSRRSTSATSTTARARATVRFRNPSALGRSASPFGGPLTTGYRARSAYKLLHLGTETRRGCQTDCRRGVRPLPRRQNCRRPLCCAWLMVPGPREASEVRFAFCAESAGAAALVRPCSRAPQPMSP